MKAFLCTEPSFKVLPFCYPHHRRSLEVRARNQLHTRITIKAPPLLHIHRFFFQHQKQRSTKTNTYFAFECKIPEGRMWGNGSGTARISHPCSKTTLRPCGPCRSNIHFAICSLCHILSKGHGIGKSPSSACTWLKTPSTPTTLEFVCMSRAPSGRGIAEN